MIEGITIGRQFWDVPPTCGSGTREAAMRATKSGGPLRYLSSIATVPAARGRGLGTALLEESLQVVDQAYLPAHLESTNRRNVSLYQRHGFTVTGPIEHLEGPTLTKMWRDRVES
jgi:ribosomal protein S18 acetylase RimI-like enzyme